MVIGAVLNGLGMAIKGVSTWDLVTPADLRYTVTMIGSVRHPPPPSSRDWLVIPLTVTWGGGFGGVGGLGRSGSLSGPYECVFF